MHQVPRSHGHGALCANGYSGLRVGNEFAGSDGQQTEIQPTVIRLCEEILCVFRQAALCCADPI